MTADEGSKSLRGRGYYLVAGGAASFILVVVLLFSFGAFNPPAATSSAATSSTTTITTTSYSVAAPAVLASAAVHAPDGYVQGSSKQLNPSEAGLVSAGYATFFTQGGSIANMTVLVFDWPQSAERYTDSVIANSKGLPGYTDMTTALSSYQHYGVCYGFGEADPGGNGAIATGVCAKGNVYIQVHDVSPSSVSSAEGDMSDLVGAAYQGAG